MIEKLRKYFSAIRVKQHCGQHADKVAAFWGSRAAEVERTDCHWTDSPIIQKHYIHPNISGCQDQNWFAWVGETFFTEPVERALSLGCGDGCLERHGAFINVFQRCDAFDISPGAIDIAQKKALESGISERVHYEVKDINNVELMEGSYDAIFCAMSLHHIENLEHVLWQVDGALKADGLFIMNEYVGPNRFQWTDRQLNIANDIFSLLPKKYRYDPTTKSVKKRIERVSVDHMLTTDPSEAVRSADILPLVEEQFDIVRRVDYGGTLVNLVLDNIIVNFDEQRSEDMALLKFIFLAEKLLIAEKIIDNNFSVVVAHKKNSKGRV
ncbi:MAG: methyltransferase domain-containing protein [Nitrospirota bacterium]